MHGFLTRAEPRARDGPSPQCEKFHALASVPQWKHPQWKFQLVYWKEDLSVQTNSLNSDQELDWSWAIGPRLNWPLSNLLSRSPQIQQQNCGLDLWIVFILKIKTSEKTKSQIAFLPDAFLFMRFLYIFFECFCNFPRSNFFIDSQTTSPLDVFSQNADRLRRVRCTPSAHFF